jgi:tetratricopeptide (TPR) repeat protein
MARKRTLKLLCLLCVVAGSLGVAAVFSWAEYHWLQALRAGERQDFAHAYSRLTEVLRVWPRSASTHLRAAQAARRAGRLQDADEHLAACQRLQEGVTDPMRLERLLLRALDRDAAAVHESLWRSVEEDQTNQVIILEALVQGSMKGPLTSLGQAAVARLLELQSDNVVGLYWRGVVRERLGDDEWAATDFRRVLDILPSHEDARQRLADLLVKTDPLAALDHLAWLRERKPSDTAVLLSQANCWKALGQPVAAAQILDTLLAEQPEHVGALIQRGLLAVQDGHAADGEQWLRRALAQLPTSLDGHYHLYECLLQQPGRAGEAGTQLAEWKRVRVDMDRLNALTAVQTDRSMHDPALIHEIGVILLRNQQEERALRLFQDALDIKPDYEPVHRTLAEHYRSKGKDDLAEEHRKMVRGGPQ